MEESRLPRFSWGKTFDYNKGHTRDEWGRKKNEREPGARFIETYAVKGKLARINTSGFLSLTMMNNKSRKTQDLFSFLL